MQGVVLFFCLLLTFSFSVQGANIPVPAAPKLAASSWVLLDHGSNQILAEHNADKRIEPASITKVMSAYVVYQALVEGLISMEDQAQEDGGKDGGADNRRSHRIAWNGSHVTYVESCLEKRHLVPTHWGEF